MPARSSGRRPSCPTRITSTGVTRTASSRRGRRLNFHYGNDRAKATVQIASYNLTDAGYRRLEANLGINQAYLTLNFPNIINENGRLNLTVGAFTKTASAGPRGGTTPCKYETYLFGRTHVAGETLTFEYDVADWTFVAEDGFGGKLEPIPFQPTAGTMMVTTQPWDPYPGPVPQESTFVHHAHVGAVWKKMLIVGAHYIDVFANDNERSDAYSGMAYMPGLGRPSTASKPGLTITGVDVKFLNGFYGDGYLGYAHLSAKNALSLADAVEVIHSFNGWQLHDNYFGAPGVNEETTGTIDTLLFQYVFSPRAVLPPAEALLGAMGRTSSRRCSACTTRSPPPSRSDLQPLQAQGRRRGDVPAAVLVRRRRALRRGPAGHGRQHAVVRRDLSAGHLAHGVRDARAGPHPVLALLLQLERGPCVVPVQRSAGRGGARRQ